MKNVQIQAAAILASFLAIMIAIQGCTTETIIHVHNGKPVPTPSITNSGSSEVAASVVSSELPVDITMILDRSGSMQSMAEQVILSYNDFIDEQKTVDGEATISLVQFNDQYTPIYAGVDIKEANVLNDETYVAQGHTALFDAIGRTIQETKKRLSPGCADVVFVITTDGLENASQEYSGKQIREMIEECEKELGWNFMFLAANVDAFNQHDNLGVRYDKALCVPKTSIGWKASQELISQKLQLYRKDRKVEDLDFNDADRNFQKDE